MHGNRRLSSNSLTEDLASIGLKQTAGGVHALATERVENRVLSPGIRPLEESAPDKRPQSLEEDPLDGKFVNRELLGRIVNLPFAHMSEEDFDELINAFGGKELPEGDQELANLAESVMQTILEGRVAIRMQAGKKIHTQRTSARKKRQSKKLARKPRSAKLAKKRAKKEARGQIDRGKLKTARRQGISKRELQMAAKAKLKKKPSKKREDMGLAAELQSLLDESVDRGEFAETQDRIFRVFALISEMTNDEVTDVLQEAWDDFKEKVSITEDLEPEGFLEMAKPCLSLIKRSLEEFELVDDQPEGDEPAEGGDEGNGEGDGDPPT